MTQETLEKAKHIRDLLVTEAGKYLTYSSWSDDFCREELRNLKERIIEHLGRVSLMGLTAEEADEIGFESWAEGSNLRLIPVWLYPFLSPGDRLESISGKIKIVGTDYTNPDTEGYIDNNQRFGVLACGVRV